MSFLSSHISFERLVDLVEDRLPASEEARLRRHLDSCSKCAGQLAWIEHTVVLMRSDELENAPPAVIARAVQLFRSRAAQPESGASWGQRVLAVLRFDSAFGTPAFGLRTGQAGVRQQLYSAGAHDLDLRLKPVGDKWVLSGQLLGSEASGRVELGNESVQVQAALNELSEFTLPPAPNGRYTLTLYLAQTEIVVTELEVGSG